MSLRSPFSRVLELPVLDSFLRATAAAPSHLCLAGLHGAARSLLSGALARAFGRRVVVLVTDTPDTALDALADVRAFVALEESAQLKGPRPLPTSAPGRVSSQNAATVAKLSREHTWADPETASNGALTKEIAGGVFLESALFPAWDVLPTESDRPEGLTLAGRRRVTERLVELRGTGRFSPYLIVAPITALMQPCEAPEQTGQHMTLRTGAEHDPILLGRKLGGLGYDRVGQVEVRGEFALRGGILDIFPYTSETPYRVDFLGETIESIKPFDPISQRSDDPVEEIEFADASPESLRRLFSPGGAGPYALLDHLPPASLLVFQDPHKLRQRAELYAASLVSGNSVFLDLDELLKRAEEKLPTLQLLSPWEAAAEPSEDAAETGAAPDAAAFVPDFPELGDGDPQAVACTTLQRAEGEIAANAETWRQLAGEREQVLVFCETSGHRQRLKSLFDEAKVPLASGGADRNGVRLVLGKLSAGFDLRDAGLAVISDREILGVSKHALDTTSRVKPKHPPGTVALQHLMDLQLGDHVVHAAHGIARYLGLARLEKSGRMEDYLTLLFANDVKLYVPAAHIGWVSKYIGGHADLELSTIGSKVWARKKERAQKAIRDIAEDLLAIQAARKDLPGIVYPPDGEWQQPFETAFPYEETADQLTAIAAIKKDMEGTCPMDRLICGDVGFGKTEVALRAAFKAASSGKQVALLAPTTLLAEQHGRTFKERFAGYPLSVDVLSRFKTAREQRRLLDRLATGRLDVVIGTHRLLQKDVRFKDLGLAIIDEEQRFGVEHKEFFKQLRRSIDVLTLTATPIPRTLHMAMLGLRDISNLTIAPRNRRPIVTKVARRSDDLLRRALLREISRGGQAFVVHPRVNDIEKFCAELAQLVPEARFAIGHGQMNADDLEDVMTAFLHGKVDVLVSTTIVESGLDIPTANTIVIHEADHFGLAELHQLRGRVGRSDLQAYCYLLLPPNRVLTPEGLRRLRALEEFDALGAGFQLALKDLEIRGAGNVLGRQQSGEIAEIGYDLYCKLLDATVRGLRGEKIEEEIEVNLQLHGAAYIPEEYVQDDKVVLEIYRRIEALREDDDIDSLRSELIDRFGPPPPPAHRMFEEAKLRRLARSARVPYIGIDNEESRLILKLHGWDLKLADRALRGLPEVKGVRILDGETLSFGLTLRAKHDEDVLRLTVRHLLEPLMDSRKRWMQ